MTQKSTTMRYFSSIFIILIFVGCEQRLPQKASFPTPTYLEQSVVVQTDSSSSMTIIVEKVEDLIKSSDIIEFIKYVPLETNQESLIGYYQNVVIYNDFVYVLDRVSARAVLIFDLNGQFIQKIGAVGGGPEEFYLLAGFSVDKSKDNLVLYDNMKRRMMYYTLDGNFIKSVNVPFSFFGTFVFLSSGTMISAINKHDGNFHLGRFDDYRLIYSDSLGKMLKFGYGFDDNINLPLSWSQLISYDNEILYLPQYLNSIYTVTDSSILQKYIIDLSKFNPFNKKMLTQFRNYDQFNDYWSITTNLEPKIAENFDHLYFVVSDKKQKLFYFYDKNTNVLVGFKTILFDREFALQFPSIYGFEDYFVGTVPAWLLKELKEYHDKNNFKMPDEVDDMIDRLNEEDNDVLVFFRIKPLNNL